MSNTSAAPLEVDWITLLDNPILKWTFYLWALGFVVFVLSLVLRPFLRALTEDVDIWTDWLDSLEASWRRRRAARSKKTASLAGEAPHDEDAPMELLSTADLQALPEPLRVLADRSTTGCRMVRERDVELPVELRDEAQAVAEQTTQVCRSWLALPQDMRDAPASSSGGTTPTQSAEATLTTLAAVAERLRERAYSSEVRALSDSANYVRARFGTNDLDL